MAIKSEVYAREDEILGAKTRIEVRLYPVHEDGLPLWSCDVSLGAGRIYQIWGSPSRMVALAHVATWLGAEPGDDFSAQGEALTSAALALPGGLRRAVASLLDEPLTMIHGAWRHALLPADLPAAAPLPKSEKEAR